MDSTTRDPKLEVLMRRVAELRRLASGFDGRLRLIGNMTAAEIEETCTDVLAYVSSVRVPESASATHCPMCDQPFDCPNGHIASVREGMAQIERGEFVTLDQMREEMAAPEFASVQEAGKRTPDVWWAEYRRRNFARWHKVGPFRTEEQARNSIPRDAANFSITRDIATETIGSQEVATPSLTVQEASEIERLRALLWVRVLCGACGGHFRYNRADDPKGNEASNAHAAECKGLPV